MIAAILLAAGSARRFGGDKLTADARGKPVIRWSAETLVASPHVDDTIVIVPPGATGDAIRQALDGLRVRVEENPDAGRGMGSSIAIGIGAVEDGTEAAMIVLGDEPGLRPDWIERIVARYRDGGCRIVAPLFRGVRGHPVLFDRAVFPELTRLSGDDGARAIVDRDGGRVAHPELGVSKTIDVDTVADLARLSEGDQLTRSPRHPAP